MKLNFKRVTSHKKFIPEIDGLRFIAITIVVLFHLNIFIREKDLNEYVINYNFDFINSILSLGHLGIPLFFVISGFILTLPFAKMHLYNNSSVNLKNYFLRRLTRLEPPYIIAMTALLFGGIYIAKSVTYEAGIVSYLYSIIYSHNFVYGRDVLPIINQAAWSLEIEIQFYILMPVIARLFLIKSNTKRRILAIILILVFCILKPFELTPFISIIDFIHFFLIGILLADFYLTLQGTSKKTPFNSLLSVLAFSIIFIVEMQKFDASVIKIALTVLQLLSVFFFFYLVVIEKSLKILANPIITNIGGMCYSIYLLHYPLISLIGNPLTSIVFSDYNLVNITIYTSIILLLTAIIISIFFLIIERPCMNKNWTKNLWKKIQISPFYK